MNYKQILIRFGELMLKGKNRQDFIKKLRDNVTIIVGEKPRVASDRFFMDFSPKAFAKLAYVFGIFSYSPCYVEISDKEQILVLLLQIIKFNPHAKTFKIATRRHDKTFPIKSLDLNVLWGQAIEAQTSLIVDLTNPDLFLEIEIHHKETYVWCERVRGLGGLPTGINGRVLHLMSGGIDSPVAAFLMMKRGVQVDLLNFHTPPHTDEQTIAKVQILAKTLARYQGKIALYQCHFTDLMNLIGLTINQSYKLILMRRSFVRIANELAHQNRYLALSSGDNLGQVASQTLESLDVISDASPLVIHRPLLSYDKSETILLAQKIQTFATSILKAQETCEIFAPLAPVTKPRKAWVNNLEHELQDLLNLEAKSVASITKTILYAHD